MRQGRLRVIVLCCVAGAAAGALALFLHRGAVGPPQRVAQPPRVIPVDLTGPTPTLDELRARNAGANVVICVLDAARRDHLGCYGYPRSTTPNIDRLAEESLVFDRHYCQHTQTRASTASLFTGQHPPTHAAYRERPLDPSTFTMARGLHAAGYHTAFFASNMWLTPAGGTAVGFDHLRAPSRGPPGRQPGRRSGLGAGPVRMGRSPEDLLAQVRDWLASRPPEAFFAYVHFLPPHAPYGEAAEASQLFGAGDPPGFRHGRLPFPEIRDSGQPAAHDSPGPELVNLYDANLRKADWAIQQVVDLLAEAEVFDDTLFILTADHGEAFGEHGYRWHARCPYDEVVHIPLLMRFPGGAGPRGRIGALTQAVDILPTVFDLLALPYPQEGVQGRSLLPLLSGQVGGINEYVFSQTEGEPPSYVVHDLRYSLLLYQGGRLRALYDTHSDPWQTRNLIDELPQEASRLAEAFRSFALEQRYPPLDYVDPHAPPPDMPLRPKRQLSDEERQELEALGYLR